MSSGRRCSACRPKKIRAGSRPAHSQHWRKPDEQEQRPHPAAQCSEYPCRQPAGSPAAGTGCRACRRSGTAARHQRAGSHLQMAPELRQRRHADQCRQGRQQLAALRQGLPGHALFAAASGDPGQREEAGAEVEPVLRRQRCAGQPDHRGEWPHLRDREPEQGVLDRRRDRPHDLEVRALAAG